MVVKTAKCGKGASLVPFFLLAIDKGLSQWYNTNTDDKKGGVLWLL